MLSNTQYQPLCYLAPPILTIALFNRHFQPDLSFGLWPWVGEFVGFIIMFTSFPTQQDLVNHKHTNVNHGEELPNINHSAIQYPISTIELRSTHYQPLCYSIPNNQPLHFEHQNTNHCAIQYPISTTFNTQYQPLHRRRVRTRSPARTQDRYSWLGSVLPIAAQHLRTAVRI